MIGSSYPLGPPQPSTTLSTGFTLTMPLENQSSRLTKHNVPSHRSIRRHTTAITDSGIGPSPMMNASLESFLDIVTPMAHLHPLIITV